MTSPTGLILGCVYRIEQSRPAHYHTLPPRDRRDTGLIRAQFGIVHDFRPESPPFSLGLESTPFCDLIRFSSALHGRVRSVTLHL
jgi:hypothetical protein